MTLLAGVWLAGLLSSITWAMLQHPPLLTIGIVFSSLVFSDACAIHFLRHQPPAGHLSWDGQYWRSTPCAIDAPGQISVHADWQWALLVCWQADGLSPRWFWLRRKLQAERWADLRRAVFSSHRVFH